jgi:hypothetical protein
VAHGPSVPRVAHGQSVPRVAHGPSDGQSRSPGPSGTQAVSPPSGTRAVSPPSDARAVSPPSGARDVSPSSGARAISLSLHWYTGRQFPGWRPAVQSVPGPGPGLEHVPSVLPNSRFARLVLVRVVNPCAGHGGWRALASGRLRVVIGPPACSLVESARRVRFVSSVRLARSGRAPRYARWSNGRSVHSFRSRPERLKIKFTKLLTILTISMFKFRSSTIL